MMHSPTTLLSALALAGGAFVSADPAAMPDPALFARAADPSVIGYFSASGGGFSDGRTCSYPATASTSGNYVQCCPATGTCPFFTACTSNTLVVGSVSVACDTDPTLACNTAILVPTAGASSGKSNLGCWQKTIGSSAFTLVQDIGSATVAPGPAATAAPSGSSATSGAAMTSTAASGSSGSGSGSGSGSNSAGGSSAGAGAASTSPSKAAAAGTMDGSVANGGLIAAVLAVVQALV